MTHDIRKSGIPALAYPHHDAASPVSLSLIFKCNESRAQATLCLQCLLPLEGFDDEQTVILQYDADNMVPGASRLGPASIPMPQERLDALAREGNPQMRTLSFKLKRVCPVWYRQSSGPLTPRAGFEAPFHQLSKLAEATELDILFDCNWLHRHHHASLHRLLEHPEQLAGAPVGQRYRQQQYRQADWTVFSHGHVDATPCHGEPPPVYAEASSKRPRRVSTSPGPSPPPKRILLSPYAEGISTSPTEKGTATPSPRPRHPATPSPILPPLAALSPLFPHSPSTKANSAQRTSKPASPVTTAADLQRAVEQAVSALLPTVVDALLPRLLATSSPTPSSQHSIASQISHAPPPPKLSALGISLHDRLASKIEGEVGGIYAHTLSHANWLRTTADDKFAEMVEEERLALDRAAESKFEDFKEQCEGMMEDVLERMGWKMEELGEGVAERLKEEKLSLQREREELKRDKEEFTRDREELRMDRQDLRREKEDLRLDKQDLRRGRERLREDQRRFESEKKAAQGTGCSEQESAESAPV